MTEETPLGKLWEDNVEVELRVVLPPKLVGGDGRKVRSRQYIPLEFIRPNLEMGMELAMTLEEMVDQVIRAVREEVERGTER